MKELTIEQKAKAYDEALERMKSWVKGEHPECFTEAQKAAEFIFPEFKESEDERIKKAIMEFFELQDDNTTYSFIPKKDILTWLEKQGEKKSADKVEPRFHEGEWVANDYCVGKVIALTDDAYLLDTGQGIPFSCEHNAHLWTIQDAKAGDVLASDNGVIILVKESRGSSWGHRLSYHCAVLYDGTFEHREFHVNSEKFFPATKEQRDLLFSKMKEARYEWDAEKKKLKKIDDEEVNGEDYGIDGFWHAKRILEKTLGSVSGYQTDDGILDHKAAITAVKKLYEQKPTWTEEDGKKLSDIISILRGEENCYYNSPILIDWLKSLKERIGG